MKISFHIDYRTNWGESVYLVGDIPALGGGKEENAVKLELSEIESWSIEIDVEDTTPDFTYRYIVRHDNGYVKREWGHGHKFLRGRNAKVYDIYDRWQDQPWDKPYYSSAFTSSKDLKLV